MFSKRLLAPLSAITALAGLLTCSLIRPADKRADELVILIEPDGTGAWRRAVEHFNQVEPGTPVRLVEGPPSTNVREDMYSTAFLSGAGYDMVYSDVIWTAKFAAAGWLLDLTPYIPASELEEWIPSDRLAGSFGGGIYRWPAFADVGLLYYRSDLIDEAPDTFAGLVAAAERLQTPDVWGFLWQGRQYEGLVAVFLEVLWGMGGDWIDTENRRVLLDTREATKAVHFLKSTVGAISPPGVTSYMEEDTRALFQSRRSLFLRSWPYVWTLAQRSDPAFAASIAVAPMVREPGNRRSGVLGGWGFSVSKATPHRDRALAFVKHITRREQLETLSQSIGRIPSRRSLVPQRFAEVFQGARSRPVLPQYAQVSDILQRWLSKALTDQETPEQALRLAAQETRALLGWSR